MPRTGDVLADAQTLVNDVQRFGPVTVNDEEGYSRIYLPSRRDFGLVVLTPLDTIWVSPLLTAVNLPDGEFDELWTRAHGDDVHWVFPLDPIAGHLDEQSLVALHAPTVVSEDLLALVESRVIYALPSRVFDALRAKLRASLAGALP